MNSNGAIWDSNFFRDPGKFRAKSLLRKKIQFQALIFFFFFFCYALIPFDIIGRTRCLLNFWDSLNEPWENIFCKETRYTFEIPDKKITSRNSLLNLLWIFLKAVLQSRIIVVFFFFFFYYYYYLFQKKKLFLKGKYS